MEIKSDKTYFILVFGACIASVLLGIATGVFFSARSLRAEEPYTAGVPTTPELPYTSGTAVFPAAGTPYTEEAMRYTGDAPAPPRETAYPYENAYTPDEELHRYLVTVVDGYVAVFYAEHAGGALKEITTSPVGGLPVTDIARLHMGIRIYTEEALARILQDYGS